MAERNVRRGEVYLLEMAAYGGRLQKVRPVLVVQNDQGNLRSAETIVAAFRGMPEKKLLPIHVVVPQGVGGLDKVSVIDAGQLSTVPIHALRRRLGGLPASLMDVVDRALEVSLGLES